MSTDMILEQGRPKVHHVHLDPSKYRYMWYYWMARVFGLYFAPMILSALSAFFIPWMYSTAFYLAGCAYAYYKVDSFLEALLKRVEGLPHVFHDKPDIKQLPTYQDEDLIWHAYSSSPYRTTLLRCAFEKGLITEKVYQDAVDKITSRTALLLQDPSAVHKEPRLDTVGEFDTVNSLMMFQPSEGFCGGGTINTMLLSIYGVPVTMFTRMPEPMGMNDFKRKLAPYLPPNNSPLKSVSLHHCDDGLTPQDFLQLVLQANDPSKRVTVNFLRAPLFNPRPSNRFYKAIAVMGGHWSPIASTIYDEQTKKYYCLILDVNQAYGAWMVDTDELYLACRTRDGPSSYRGLVVIDIDQSETSTAH